jgi:hypothetical protein
MVEPERFRREPPQQALHSRWAERAQPGGNSPDGGSADAKYSGNYGKIFARTLFSQSLPEYGG